ncbi:hypothetical protein ACFXTH_040950 [Malus domestica]
MVAGAPREPSTFVVSNRLMVNQGGSGLGFVEGNEGFKMVVAASKNSTGIGRNWPWKMGGHNGCGYVCKATGRLGAFPFLFFFLFLIGSHSP